MSITVKDVTNTDSQQSFPMLRRLKRTAPGFNGQPVIVLFSKPNEGVALAHPNPQYIAISSDWTDCFNIDYWEPCSVTIS